MRALACAVMHCAFRDGHADRAYLGRYTDLPADLEAHLAARGPAWAAAITGLSVEEIEAFATLYNTTQRAYIRVGYGFTRSRNGAAAMHAVTCLPAVTGAWQHEAGGAFWSNRSAYHWNKTMIEGLDALDKSTREIDMCLIGAALAGDARALKGGPPVAAMLIQNTNPAVVAPDSSRVRQGLAREDLFTVVHEQFLTETARYADVVLPATMFLEHDDLYQAGGHSHIQVGPKLVEPPGECRSNHEVLQGLARRLGAQHPGFEMSAMELIDWTLRASGWPDAKTVLEQSLGGCGAAVPGGALPGRLRYARQEVPLCARLVERRVGLAAHAAAARPVGHHRRGDGRPAVPPGDLAGPTVPQHLVHRDARARARAKSGRRR